MIDGKGMTCTVLSFVFMVTLASAGGNFEHGKKLFNDPSLSGSTNARSCNSCHPDGKGLEYSADNFRVSGKSLEDRVNDCIRKPLGGTPLKTDSQEMKDLIAYIESLGGK